MHVEPFMLLGGGLRGTLPLPEVVPDEAGLAIAGQAFAPRAPLGWWFRDFGASGPDHYRGMVPDPGATAGSTKFLREDAAWSVPAGTGGSQTNGLCEGRLTTEAGVPVSTSDRTAQGTLYFTPFRGNRLDLYDGTNWATRTFSEINLALTLTSAKNYDVFGNWTGSAAALELSAAWTNDTTRADALAVQDGVYVKSGATTRRYLGTIRASGTNVTEDSEGKRFVWNAYNRILRYLSAVDPTNSWVYGSSTIRQANANSANQVEYVQGLNEDPVAAFVVGGYSDVSTSFKEAFVGVGVDSTTVNSAKVFGAVVRSHISTYAAPAKPSARYVGNPGIGYHYLAWLEATTGTVNATWYGDNGSSLFQSGLVAEVLG